MATIYQTPKGWLITVWENKVKHKYFFRDEEHTLFNSLCTIFHEKRFTLGLPFGDNIYPIIVTNHITIVYSKIFNLSRYQKASAIWKYYRELVNINPKPRYIKYWANEMKYNLKEYGIENLHKIITSNAWM